MQAGFNAKRSPACEPDLMPIRALLVDDNESFLAAASGLLEGEGLSVVGTANDGAEAHQLTARLLPDVILVDIVLGAESGFDLARTLVADHEPTPAVILPTLSPAVRRGVSYPNPSCPRRRSGGSSGCPESR